MTSTTTRRTTAATLAAAVAMGAAAVAGTGTAVSAETTTDPSRALLRAAEMPEVNEVQDWERTQRRPGRVSLSQDDSFRSLGAEQIARRDFGIDFTTSLASNVVMTFDTAAEAKSAYQEVKGWRQHTGDNIPDQGRLLYTGPGVPVTVEQGRGLYYSFVYKLDEDEQEGVFEWVGVTRRGTAVSVVAWRVGGQDATYEVDPTIASVERANEKLGAL